MSLRALLLLCVCAAPLWAGAPVVTSFVPASAIPGASITISGSGFSQTPSANIVWFGGAAATVVSASGTQLVVNVPTGATYAPIAVTTGGLSGYSSLPFTPLNASRRVLTGRSFAAPVNYPTGGMMRMGAIADIDGDGRLDMIGTNDNNTLSIFLNTSTPGTIDLSSFASAPGVPTGIRPYFVASGDFDGDGKLDLAVANNTDGSVTVLRNTGTAGASSFTSLTVPVAGALTALAIADFDGDGKPDIVATSNFRYAYLLRNTGGGDTLAFTPAGVLTTANGCLSMAAGDVDGDGLPDVVIANGSSAVTVFRNASVPGRIAFGDSLTITGFNNPWSVAIGDIDGDGKPDLAIGSYLANVVSVVRNTGSPGHLSFAPKLDLFPGSLSWNIALGDVDGDGKVDLVVPNTSLGTVAVFVNGSAPDSIAFHAPLTYPTGNGSMSIEIGDMDGDGLQDLVIGNFYSGQSIAVMRAVPPSGGHAPLIRQIAFPPNDVAHVRVTWFRTTDDSAGAPDPALQYSIWLRVPDPGSAAPSSAGAPAGVAAIGPPWQFELAVPAIGLDQYAATVDVPYSPSHPWLVLMVVAQTKSGQVYASAPDSIQDAVTVTSAEESGQPAVPAHTALEQNYPNPFNPSTIIRYALPRAGAVTLAVYNALGQQVALLAAGMQDEGYHEARFDGTGLPSGVYFYRLRAGMFVQTRKLLLLR